MDTDCYEDALQNTLRQAPDVILIGEIRSRETMEHALAFAETGHLCLSTLHANNANQALDRIINFFPEERHNQLLLDLSLNLRGIVSQRLVSTVDHKRTVAVEILLGTPRVKDLIKKGDIDEIKEVMEKSNEQGMRTFDQALMQLCVDGRISMEEALRNADSANNLRLQITLHEKAGGAPVSHKIDPVSPEADQEAIEKPQQEQNGAKPSDSVKEELRRLKRQAMGKPVEKKEDRPQPPSDFTLQPLAGEER